MYALRQFFISVFGAKADEIVSDELVCVETNTETTFYTNRMQDTLAAYTYTLVEQGTLTLNYNGRLLTLHRGDIYIYSPGFQITIVSGSPDYHALCLMADENMTLTTPAIRNIIRAAYLPIVSGANLWCMCLNLGSDAYGNVWSRWSNTNSRRTASAMRHCVHFTPYSFSTFLMFKSVPWAIIAIVSEPPSSLWVSSVCCRFTLSNTMILVSMLPSCASPLPTFHALYAK